MPTSVHVRAAPLMRLFTVAILVAHHDACFVNAKMLRHCMPRMLAGRAPVPIEIDLGPEGEPVGKTTLKVTPKLPNSELLCMDLGLPLGLMISVVEDGSGSVAGMWYQKTRVVVDDTLPGYSAHGAARKGDLLRAVTGYRSVVLNPEGFQAFKQVASGTPVGAGNPQNVKLRRIVYKCDSATYDNVREAISSHNEGNRIATLVLERSLDTVCDDSGAGKPDVS